MGGLYNMLFGVNPLAGTLVHILGLHSRDIPRLRDAWLDAEGRIVILTRAGGPNRDDYTDGINMMRDVKGYIEDKDDDFDNTYATFTYAMPAYGGQTAEEVTKIIKALAESAGIEPPTKSLKERFEEAANMMAEQMKKDRET